MASFLEGHFISGIKQLSRTKQKLKIGHKMQAFKEYFHLITIDTDDMTTDVV